MKKYRDTGNYYLSKLFKDSELNYDSLWLFYHHEEGIQMEDFFPGQKAYSFLWEYSDDNIPAKIDQWKRAFRRNHVEIPPAATLHALNYFPAGKTVYLDCLESDFVTADEKFKKITAHHEGQRFVQIVTAGHVSFGDIDLGFLEMADTIEKWSALIRILETDGIRALLLSGYHHRGELIKVCIVKSDDICLTTEDPLPLDIFENTYVAMPFKW